MPFRYKSAVGAAVAFAIALPSIASAAETPAEDELREVIVTARSLEVTTPLELSRYGNDVEFVTAAEIKKQGFVDAGQALEMLVPGAYIAPQAGAFSYLNISLQGSRTGDVLWTVDGVRINNRLYGSTSPADTLPASMIERIEVLKGGQGLLYGTQSVAGVINVVTRAFSDETDGAVSVGGDSNEGLHVNGYARGAVGEHHFVGWASKDRTDGFRIYDAYQPDATTRDRRYDVDSYGLRYGFDFTDALRLTLQGVHTDAAIDFATVAGTDVNKRDEDTWSGRLDWSPNERTQLFVKSYLHDWDTNYYPLSDPADTAYWGYKDFGLSAAGRFDAGHGFEYHLGYEFQNYRGRDDYLLIEEKTEKVHAVYAQVRTTDDLSTRTRFTAGVRHNDGGGNKATIWSTSGVFDITSSLYVEGTLGTSFQLPDAYQLYAIDPTDTHGNADLKPEKSFNVNLALGGRLAAGAVPLQWQVTGWKRRVKNLIVDDDTDPPAGFGSVFVNSDARITMSGIELLLRGSLTDALSFTASYMNSRERAGGSSVQLADRPRNSGKLAVGFEPAGSGWGTEVALKYMGSTYANVSGFGRTSYGDAVIANLGAWWFPDAGRRHRIGLRVENLFDTDYATRIRSATYSDSETEERFMYRNLGAPRTAFLNYTYSF